MTQLMNCPNCGAYRDRLVVSSLGCDRCEGRTPEEQMAHIQKTLHEESLRIAKLQRQQDEAPPDLTKYRGIKEAKYE